LAPSSSSATVPLRWPIFTRRFTARPSSMTKAAHSPPSRNRLPAGICSTSAASHSTKRASTR
jgi:hypothetical protein